MVYKQKMKQIKLYWFLLTMQCQMVAAYNLTMWWFHPCGQMVICNEWPYREIHHSALLVSPCGAVLLEIAHSCGWGMGLAED